MRRWAALRNLNDAFCRFASALDKRLSETVQATQTTIRQAHMRRKEKAKTVGGEMTRLKSLEAE